MKTVYKYPLTGQERPQVVDMPDGAKILSVQEQDHVIMIWALVDPDAQPLARVFKVVGTGHPLGVAENWDHIGTVVAPPFVWHVFAHPVPY